MTERDWFDQPIIITDIGTYLTRSGNEVEIHEIKHSCQDQNCKTTTCFAAKGTLIRYTTNRAGKSIRMSQFNIWHISGRLMPDFQDRPDDIISKIEK